MPLEAVMICVDNSDYTRNGDYAPTRFASETDAVNLVCGAKTQQNPENSVGILSTAGDRVEVMITPTQDLGRMIAELAKLQIKSGNSDILRAIQTAQLALKHRQNKNQKQRIIAFVGSPVTATDKELETLGKNLKKNNVSLDLVSFGEVEDNSPKLQKLLGAVNSNETSHIVEVPVGPKLLSDVLLSSVIVNPDGEAAAGGGGGGGGDFEFGINPNDDPELALALRISMEEERARQQQQQAASGDGAAAPADGAAAAAPAAAGGDAPAAAAAPAPAAAAAPAPAAAMPMATDAAVLEAMGMEDMDEELRQALLLSLQEAEPMDTSGGAPAAAAPAADAPAAPKPAEPAAPPPAEKDVPMADASAAPAAAKEPAAAAAAPAAEAKAAAPAASGSSAAPAAGGEEAKAGGTVDSSWFQDPSFVQELLGSLPGVDINDPRIQMALAEVGGDEKKEGEGGSGSGDKGSSDKDKDASK